MAGSYLPAIPVKSLPLIPPASPSGNGVYVLANPMTNEELSALVPPQSTVKTGMNCMALGMYTVGLVSADFAKAYSDALAHAVDRFNADKESVMDVEDTDRFMTTLETTERFMDVMAIVRRHMVVNIDATIPSPRFGPDFLNLASLGPSHDAATELLELFTRLPTGYICPIRFSRSPQMDKGQGLHVVAFWKQTDTTGLLIDIQRGLCSAGGQCILTYNQWKRQPGVFAENISLLPNALVIRFQTATTRAESVAQMRETIVRYMVRQGMLWDYYDPTYTEDQLLAPRLTPTVDVCVFSAPIGFVQHYKIPHNNALLESDVHSEEFVRTWSKTRGAMHMEDDSVLGNLGKTFYETMASLPILVVYRPYVLSSQEIKIQGQRIRPLDSVRVDGSVAYVYITIPPISGRGRRRPLSSPTRKVRRSSSASKKRYTRRRRALRS